MEPMVTEYKLSDDKVTSLKKKRLDKRMKQKSYFKLLDEYETAKFKVLNPEKHKPTPEDILSVIELSQYFMDNAMSEYTKLAARDFYDKYGEFLLKIYTNITKNPNGDY